MNYYRSMTFTRSIGTRTVRIHGEIMSQNAVRSARESPLVEINEQLSQVGRGPLHVIGDFEVEIGRVVAAKLESFQVRKWEDSAFFELFICNYDRLRSFWQALPS